MAVHRLASGLPGELAGPNALRTRARPDFIGLHKQRMRYDLLNLCTVGCSRSKAPRGQAVESHFLSLHPDV